MINLPPLLQFFELNRFSEGLWLIFFVLILVLIIGAFVIGSHNWSQVNRAMKVLRIMLTCSAGLLVLLCLLNVIVVVRLIYGHYAPGISFGSVASQTMLTFLLSGFGYHSVAMAFASIFVLVPSTRTYPHIAWTSTLFLVAITLPITILTYFAWWSGGDFQFYVRNLAPPLACLVAAAVWFGSRVGIAFVQKRDMRTWTIIGLVVFHLVCLCTYTFLLCLVEVRTAPPEMRGQ